ncbi:MAG: hypothetical protein ACR2J3_07135 [Aridibacter sp.]
MKKFRTNIINKRIAIITTVKQPIFSQLYGLSPCTSPVLPLTLICYTLLLNLYTPV